MRGGARPGAGRPPAENSRAKDRARKAAEAGKPAKSSKPVVIDDGTWTTLPFEGRAGNPPAWPLSKPTKADATSRRELVVWRQLWKLPEAMAWERAGTTFQVALYVRTLVRAESPDAPIAAINQLRLQMDGLGLTPYGKKTLRWKVGQSPRVQAAAKAAEVVAPVGETLPAPSGGSPRDRLRVVPHVAS